jgi:hypothetical protein
MHKLFILLVITLSQIGMPLYIYDRINNRPISSATAVYDIKDTSNIFYTSDVFHSIEYVKNNKTMWLRNANSSKSMPELYSRTQHQE